MNVLRWSSARVVVYSISGIAASVWSCFARFRVSGTSFVFTPAPPCGQKLDEWLAEFEEKEFVQPVLVISCGLSSSLRVNVFN